MKLLKIIFLTCIASLFYFPVQFTGLSGFNTKMIFAVFGILILIAHLLKDNKGVVVENKYIYIYLWAFLFSFWCNISVVENNTNDYVYCFYFVNMSVWLFGALTVVSAIKYVDGDVSMESIFKYLGYVCLAQCILAFIIDNNTDFADFIDRHVQQDQAFLHRTNRLYGIGASFDTAGIRFSAALLGVAYLVRHAVEMRYKIMYWAIFIAVVVMGNAISRTTTVGSIIGLVYIFMDGSSKSLLSGIQAMRFKVIIYLAIIFLTAICVYLYYHNPTFKHYVEYGFEGFFNFVNTGEWSTSSTSKLSNMVVWPDNPKTWFIGDGWFADPEGRGFYMFTDVGYLRFIFYCGVIGLAIFTGFFICCTKILRNEAPSKKFLFFLLLCINLICWIKISTDIFPIYALLLLLNKRELNNEPKETEPRPLAVNL